MRALIFDPYSGASGDMIMGSLLDLGADLASVTGAVESVGCSLITRKEERGHIQATRAEVTSDRRYKSLKDALSILKSSSLSGKSLDKALKIMDLLACAESKVHGIPKDEIRFHEVGALDALADIAGSCAALESLDVDQVFSLPISVGSGTVSSCHGLLPVPGPATLEILRSSKAPWRWGPVNQELLTPTGAAVLSNLAERFLEEPPFMRAESVGYGAGKRDLEIPNLLRAVVCHSGGTHRDEVVQLEANLDDVTGEVMGNLIDLLMDSGALDVSVIPAVMKKGRPGNVIRAIVRKEDAIAISGLIMSETGSLGVRVFPSLHRHIAERMSLAIALDFAGKSYDVNFKVSKLDGKILNVKPEFEDCRRISLESKVPLRVVIKKAEEAGWRAVEA